MVIPRARERGRGRTPRSLIFNLARLADLATALWGPPLAKQHVQLLRF
jgi:hypothetical protein